jgi:hypothetical protein
VLKFALVFLPFAADGHTGTVWDLNNPQSTTTTPPLSVLLDNIVAENCLAVDVHLGWTKSSE